MVGPVIAFFAMAVAHGVVAHIVPFLIVAFVGAESLVPELSLPKGPGVFGCRFPFAGSCIFPKGDPAFEWDVAVSERGAKEMQVVRQDHISADKPMRGVGPCFAEKTVHGEG